MIEIKKQNCRNKMEICVNSLDKVWQIQLRIETRNILYIGNLKLCVTRSTAILLMDPELGQWQRYMTMKEPKRTGL